MNPALLIIFLILLLTPTDAKCRRKTFKLTDDFCANVPTEGSKLDIHAFAGVWFQIFLTSGTDIGNQINQCVTAKYVVRPNNSTIKDLICEFSEALQRPRCIRGTLIKREDGGPGSLTALGGPTGSFPMNVVATLGSKTYGYFALALFQCNRGTPRTPGYFILARKPIFQRKILHKMKKKLRCFGFPLPNNMDFALTNHKRCKYFFNRTGFDVLTPEELIESIMMNR